MCNARGIMACCEKLELKVYGIGSATFSYFFFSIHLHMAHKLLLLKGPSCLESSSRYHLFVGVWFSHFEGCIHLTPENPLAVKGAMCSLLVHPPR
jgi:hypothetical protein